MKHAQSSSAPKRARTSKECNAGHDCTDDNCSCCGDGPVQLDDQVLSQPANVLLSMALEEIDSTGDRAVVIKLFETAIEKYGDEKSMEHAWALLRFGEYAEYMEYAEKAVLLARELNVAGDLEKAQCELLEARAQVLSFCLEQSNWRDPAADDSDNDDVDEDVSKPIAGEQKLVESLAQLVAAHNSLFDERSAAPSFIDAYRGTLTFLFARREAHALTSRMLLVLFDAAVSIVYAHEGWLATSSSASSDNGDDMRKIAHQAALVWAMAAAECLVDAEVVEARLEPIVKYLSSQPNDAECCKLYAQLLLVLCGCYEDEEKAMNAYELASSKLAQAHKLSPDDLEIKSQLADMGQPLN
ncbi:hypothetical protein GGI19_006115 [Coemansia pectinata]|uniref:Uncharacterized protein n=1 Tax=Coemansia pectinata TaxID=1052879 RepID=A0A9W8L8I3_9FUNG|nr:hypothetical protein GGI19_006115 [Coemansia pectinata]